MTNANNDWTSCNFASAVRRVLESRGNGGVYEIRVSVPEGRGAGGSAVASGAGGKLPVIYALDGDAIFGTLTEAIARTARRSDATNVGPAIVVAISRSGDAGDARRHVDYTAGPPAEEPANGRDTGGAAAFLEFLERDLVPLIERDFPADPGRRVLFGHSLAGYFVLHALTQPKLFASYVAVSPSIWWDEPRLRAGLARLSRAAARVLIGVGEWEGELPPWQRDTPGAVQARARREQRAMLERARSFADALRDRLGASNVVLHLFPDEDHASVVLVAISRALRFVTRTVTRDASA